MLQPKQLCTLLIGSSLLAGCGQDDDSPTPAVDLSLLPQTEQPVFTPAVNIDQARLLAGDYSLRKVLESGGQFLTTPYSLRYDFWGEGADGPRAAQRAAFYPHVDNFPFLKLNGLGAQSCFECHHSIGEYVEPGTESSAKTRKPGVIGGSSGLASNAFINPDFPDPIVSLIRNPPHVFGTGYTQQLAYEMTHQLLAARELAHSVARFVPGTALSWPLSAKGSDFGVFITTYNAANNSFADDYSQVVGVEDDLVVRPFQWKGIASSVRHFVRDALDFHFSLQAVEKVGHIDCDKDSGINEVSVGNVSALTSFVAMTRPPAQQLPSDPAQLAQVEQGEALFHEVNGEAFCTSCHTASLTLDDPTLIIETPPTVDTSPGSGFVCPDEPAYLVDAVDKDEHAVQRHFAHRFAQAKDSLGDKFDKLAQAQDQEALAKAIAEAMASFDNESHYDIDLTNPGDDLPPYIYPRLPESDGQVVVPLFSDLKTHNMGTGLSDITSQDADVSGISIAPKLFLTRPLWGVADTGPWLHDGRANSLLQAILHHCSNTETGIEGTCNDGSEASSVINTFKQLSEEEQLAIIAFLNTQRLPIEQGLSISDQ